MLPLKLPPNLAPVTLPLIIDCDPGVDDGVALLLAFASPELQLLGVSTVGGNVSAGLTARNARIIRQIAGREDVPVFAGAERPVVRPPIEADHFHGESGIGSLPVFEPAVPNAPGHAVDFLLEAVMSRPSQTVTLAITGPMTNVALAMRLEPRFAPRLKQIVAMGGARREGGNITASAEYNIYADPHAAQIVLSSGAPVVLFGLDATPQVRASKARIAAIRAGGTPSALAATALLEFIRQTERRLVGPADPPLHDPCPIVWLLDPDLFEVTPASIEVECASPLTLGHTAVEFRLTQPDTPVVHWVTRAQSTGVFTLIAERLSQARPAQAGEEP